MAIVTILLRTAIAAQLRPTKLPLWLLPSPFPSSTSSRASTVRSLCAQPSPWHHRPLWTSFNPPLTTGFHWPRSLPPCCNQNHCIVNLSRARTREME
ncbi:tRNA uridine-5-carboxymethylaminomethy [Sesbania bispinosa]|nr:tRNA uridine-5-carboxymethylaminomethy [Sesbania bispinosa]